MMNFYFEIVSPINFTMVAIQVQEFISLVNLDLWKELK